MIKSKGYAAATAQAPLAPYAFERREPVSTMWHRHQVLRHLPPDIHQARGEFLIAFSLGSATKSPGWLRGRQSRHEIQIGEKVGVAAWSIPAHLRPVSAGVRTVLRLTPIWTYNSRDKDARQHGRYSDNLVVDENYVLRMPEILPLVPVRRCSAPALRLLPAAVLEGGARQESGHLAWRPGHMGSRSSCPAPRSRCSALAAKTGRRQAFGADHFYAL